MRGQSRILEKEIHIPKEVIYTQILQSSNESNLELPNVK